MIGDQMNIRANNFQITARAGKRFYQTRKGFSPSKQRNKDRKIRNGKHAPTNTHHAPDEYGKRIADARVKCQAFGKWDVPIVCSPIRIQHSEIIIVGWNVTVLPRIKYNTNHRISNLHLLRVSKTYHLSFTHPLFMI